MPLPKPKEGQSQSDFMEDCMHEAAKNEGRSNDQNVAMCMGAWRDAHGGKKPSDKMMPFYLSMWKRLLSSPAYRNKIEILDTSTPAAGESEEAFMARCAKELTSGNSTLGERDASDACRLTWSDYSKPPEMPEQRPPAMAGKQAQVARVLARWK